MKMKQFNKCVILAGLLSAGMAISSCTKEVFPLYDDEIITVTYDYNALADSLQAQTYQSYISANGNYFVQDNQGNSTFHYWPNAHVLDVMLDAYLRKKDEVYVQRMKTLLNGIKTENKGAFPNDFYDDMGWLALSSLNAYDATKDEAYMQATDILWTDMKKGITNVMGGGMGWSKGKPNFKNTPANGPAIILASRLYRHTNNAADLETAKSLYTWLKNTLVEPGTYRIWDGINSEGDGELTKNKYTYNYGLFIGAGVEMFKTTKESAYLNDAVKTANGAIADLELAPGGILKDEGQGDGGLFKGIFVRYLTLLINQPELSAGDREKYVTFLKFNAQTLYKQGISRPGLMISPAWNKAPSGKIDLTTQLSGLMLIEAAASLEKSGLLK
jgi:predicted alpha-1,6-mannanase (GH76 family)